MSQDCPTLNQAAAAFNWPGEARWANFNAAPLPSEIGLMTSLKQLDLGYANFSGPVPSTYQNLKQLEYIDIGQNANLNGSFPDFIGGWSNLKHLFMGGNQFTGSIPSSIYTLTNLVHIDVSHNSLSGSILPDIGKLTSLTVLLLNVNSFSGALPDELYGLSNLIRLDVSGNKLSGGLSPNLGKLTKLYALNLNNNAFSGSVPASLNNLKQLGSVLCDLRGNKGITCFDRELFPFNSCIIELTDAWPICTGPSSTLPAAPDNSAGTPGTPGASGGSAASSLSSTTSTTPYQIGLGVAVPLALFLGALISFLLTKRRYQRPPVKSSVLATDDRTEYGYPAGMMESMAIKDTVTQPYPADSHHHHHQQQQHSQNNMTLILPDGQADAYPQPNVNNRTLYELP
ncbi:hypothetical protein RI367_008304 [Sorochytrium milnesiophthora]